MTVIETLGQNLKVDQLVLDIDLNGSLDPCLFKVISLKEETNTIYLEFISKVDPHGDKIEKEDMVYGVDSTGYSPFSYTDILFYVVE